ncbi:MULTISPECIES: helix-turn-helix domain-containing protein [unclassified Exiguobacterium]|uniref:winged helix-turn-helix transcriptional regulator n=1 Tax=unclassified Exiguobacterium TaxID=2644629 RepID=UPI001EF3ED7E|nr:helix-turn-helix domain-containing protein [Exiguobacterium sp. N4-1P]
MNQNKKHFYCNVELSLDVMGGKWKPLIIYHIGGAKILRFGELKRKIPNVNERVLSRQLKELVDAGLVKRTVYDELPLKVEYALEDLGQALLPILKELGTWGKTYHETYEYGEISFSEEYE